MKCDVCKQPMTVERVEFFHYTESGLPNVYLSGIEVEACGACGGQSPRIPRILALHEALAEALCLKSSPLTGAEARFLRKELGMRAKDWAAYLHVDAATLSRWENDGQASSLTLDVFARSSYLLLRAAQKNQPPRADLLEKLSAIAQRYEEQQAMVILESGKKPRVSFRPLRELTYV